MSFQSSGPHPYCTASDIHLGAGTKQRRPSTLATATWSAQWRSRGACRACSTAAAVTGPRTVNVAVILNLPGTIMASKGFSGREGGAM